ncbi:MAG TPA: hypothetical protein VKZ79_07665 [Alphaproteobacteria bacterium]|nr:hypothetical protein [Alphaproteobacteria bacterium]
MLRLVVCFVLLSLASAARADTDALPHAGEHLSSLPGQPLCASLDELVLYLRSELGVDRKPRKFKSCGDMPEGVDFIVLDVSAENPELPVRPAKIRIVAPNGRNSVTGWTVLVSNDR